MRSAFALALLLGALGFAAKADAQQALSHEDNRHPPIHLRYAPPPGYSWVSCPNPYGPYGYAAPWDRPGMPAAGAPIPQFCPGQCAPNCFPNPCCAKFQQCLAPWCNACKTPVSPYGYAPGGWVRSPRDYFLQPGY